MSATWYEVGKWGDKIEPVEVERSTEQSVWVFNKWRVDRVERRARVSEHACYFPTWEEAHAYLLDRAETRLAGARRALALAQSAHGNVKGMRKPA